MTERLYYDDPYLREFEAAVVDVSSLEGRPVVVLDRTAFYPSSGGQPFDTGTLGGSRVLDVVDGEDGRVVHVVDRTPGERTVRGSIDWPRRFDHMQQHTGQHVLSAAFDHLFGVRTESFHLGAEVSTIDLAREVSPHEIAAAEDESNRVVWEDRPVEIRFAAPDEAAKLQLRKESKREGRLRLIDVTGFDLSACGGTHVSSTGAIGVIAATAAERFRGGTRLSFVCGGRALREYRTLRDAIAGSVRTLSVLPAELPAAIERVQADAKELRRQVKDLQGRVAEHEAASLAADAETVGPVCLVCASRPGWDMSALKILASRVAERPGFVAVLVGDPPPCTIVIARGPEVAFDAASLLKALVARHGGKGGGRPEMAQGGGLDAPAAAILASARALVAEGAGGRS